MQYTPSVPVGRRRKPWYTQTWFMFVMLIFVQPVGWYLLWKYRDWHLGTKAALVVASIVWVIYANVSQEARQKAEKQSMAQTTPKPIPASQKSAPVKTQTSPSKKNSSSKSSLETNKNIAPVNTRPQTSLGTEQDTANDQAHEAATEVATEDAGCKEVKNSAWDGSVFEVKVYLRSNLHDWRSTQFVEWSPVAKDPKLRISVVRCKFRTKNGLGAYVLKNWVFYLGCDGKVLSYENYPQL